MQRIILTFMFLSLPLMACDPSKEELQVSETKSQSKNVLHILACLEGSNPHKILYTHHLACTVNDNNTFNPIANDAAQMNAQYSIGVKITALKTREQQVTLDYTISREKSVNGESVTRELTMSFEQTLQETRLFDYNRHYTEPNMPTALIIQTYATQDRLLHSPTSQRNRFLGKAMHEALRLLDNQSNNESPKSTLEKYHKHLEEKETAKK